MSGPRDRRGERLYTQAEVESLVLFGAVLIVAAFALGLLVGLALF